MDTAKMMTDAYNMQKAIEGEIVEVEENGIKIVIGGDLKIKHISINDKENDILKNAVNSSIRKAQEVQVLKMKEMVDLNNVS